MNFFDKSYIRLTLALIASSVVLDLLWLLMYASSKWNPSTVSNNTIYQIGYMRFIVFFTIMLIPLKISLFSFMFRHRNTESDSRFVVSLGLMKIFLSANKTNPISRGLINNALIPS
jgi:membrane protease YdiL (CAAX protease family)